MLFVINQVSIQTFTYTEKLFKHFKFQGLKKRSFVEKYVLILRHTTNVAFHVSKDRLKTKLLSLYDHRGLLRQRPRHFYQRSQTCGDKIPWNCKSQLQSKNCDPDQSGQSNILSITWRLWTQLWNIFWYLICQPNH